MKAFIANSQITFNFQQKSNKSMSLKPIKILITIAIGTLTQSCATITMSKRQNVDIVTHEMSPKISINDYVVSNSSDSVRVSLFRGGVQSLSLDYGKDYLPIHSDIVTSGNRSGIFYITQIPNILTFGAGWVVDSWSNRGYRYKAKFRLDQHPIHIPVRDSSLKFIQLERMRYADSAILPIEVNGFYHHDLDYAMDRAQRKHNRGNGESASEKFLKESLLEVRSKKSKLSSPPNEELLKILRNGGFVDSSAVFKDYSNTLYVETTLLRNQKFELALSKRNSLQDDYVNKRLMIEWKIKNIYGEILDTIITSSYSSSLRKNYSYDGKEKFNGFTKDHNRMNSDAIVKGYMAVYESESFQDLLKINDTPTQTSPTTIALPLRAVQNGADAMRATVIVRTKKGHGSGFSVSEDGYIITNYHVISGTNPQKPMDIMIIDNSGATWPARFIKASKDHDLALLKIDKVFESSFVLPDGPNAKLMDNVVAIGTPMSESLSQSFSSGTVSGFRSAGIYELLQLSMAVNSGNSGGPLLTEDGSLKGVVTGKLVGNNVEGIGFAIPAYRIAEYLGLIFI